jgi:ribosomal protein L10
MKKGIYCLEGLWDNDLKNKSTVLPILELLDKGGICRFIYHTCATKEELEFFLNKWKQKSIISKFPILYLAFHGKKGQIYITDKSTYSLNDLAVLLENSAQGKVVFFASCETLNTASKTIQSFLKKTNAIAAIGYKQEVDWMIATAFELLVLDALQQDKFDSKGIENIETKIKSEYGNLHQILDCRIVVNKYLHFPRKRILKLV